MPMNLHLQYQKNCSDAWYGMGVIYLEQNEIYAFYLNLKKAIDIQPDNSDYWFILGEAQAELRKTE